MEGVGVAQVVTAILAFPGAVVLWWFLNQITRGDLKTKGHHDEVLAVRKESEDRAWATVAEVRVELREATRETGRLADAVAELGRLIRENQQGARP